MATTHALRFPLSTPRTSITVLLLLLSFLSLFIIPTSSLSFTPSFTNSEVRRYVDLTSHVEEVSIAIKATNTGSSPSSSYLVSVPSSKTSHLSFVDALISPSTSVSHSTFQRLYEEKERKNRLVTRPVDVTGVDLSSSSLSASNLTFFAVDFPTSVQPSSTITFVLFLSFTRTLTPFPSHKLQDEHQLVLYHDSPYFLSPYPTSNQRSTFKLQSSHIESYTRKHASVSSDAIEYGPFTDSLPALSYSPLSIHYQNDAPFITMLSMRKEIEISQWGNIAITEWYEMKHTGAILTGPFSRFEYQSKGNKAYASFNSLIAYLPPLADGIYYRDYIGNVSTSHLRKSTRPSTDTLLEVQPRFPMVGGWKAEFEIGYNVPASRNLFVIDSPHSSDSHPGSYLLNTTFGSMFPAPAVDQAEVRVIFPEGSTNIQWSTVFDVDEADAEGLHFTHLDTTGRPVLTLRKANVVRFHNQPFLVSYTFSPVLMMREPALVIVAVMGFFVLSMIYYRVELGVGYEGGKLE